MASAVTVIFGANSTQFQAELARMQTLTMASARRISSASAAGHIAGMSGLIREGITIPREIIEGRGIGRVIGSLSLFSQYLHSATSAQSQAASGARMLADAYAQQSLKADLAAMAAMKKAEVSAAAATLDQAASKEFIGVLTAEKAAQDQAAQAAVAAAKKVAEAARQKSDAAKKAFDDSYKKAQAPGGLTIDSMNQMQADRAVMKSAAATAEADALKADAALATATATQEKTAAELEAAIAAENNANATTVAANANVLEAKTATAAAAALRIKAAATETDAAAQETLEASTATTVSGFKLALAFIVPFALLLVILGAVYMIYKELAEIISEHYGAAEKEAAAYSREHTLASWEEIEALEKLKDASEKYTESIKKMNEAKDHSVELARDAVEASNAQSDATEKLNDAVTKSKLLDVDIAEKKGLITHAQAVQQKSTIESQAIADKAAAQQAKLDNAAKIYSDRAKSADTELAKANAASNAANDKLNNSPEAQRRIKLKATLDKDLEAAKRDAASAIKDRDDYSPGMNLFYNSSLAARLKGFHGAKQQQEVLKENADAAEAHADAAEARVNLLKRKMSPDEQAAAEAARIAGEKNSAAQNLQDMAAKAATAAAQNAANSPTQVAAEQANIKKQEAIDLLPDRNVKGYELNSQQKIGAYAATAPLLLQQLNTLRSIDHKVTPVAPPSNHPPGERKPQLGTKPDGKRHQTGINVWYS